MSAGRHAYIPKVPVEFVAPSYFCGRNNELVVGRSKGGHSIIELDIQMYIFSAGDIHIWDQESGLLAHHIRGHTHPGDITCIAWNQATEDPYIFAEGTHDGTVRIWTRAPAHDATDHIAHSEGCDSTTANAVANYFSRISRTSSPDQMEQQSNSSLSMNEHYEAFRRTSV